VPPALTACGTQELLVQAELIPPLSSWVDCGTVFEAGSAGEWDLHLWGGFAASVVKRQGQYLFYYQGSDGFHETEGTVTHRSVGVATSRDGIEFEKYAGNPVLTFSPRGNHEEGAVSTAPYLDEAGRVVMYYGANTWAGGEAVVSDARLAISDDGLHFEDAGMVLDHLGRDVWGSGDEIFPVAALREGEREVIYYIPNGTLQRGRLGVAWRDGTGQFRSRGTSAGRTAVPVWGPASAMRLDAGIYALFLTNLRPGQQYLEVRMVSPARPTRLGDVVQQYRWDGVTPRAVLLDEEEGRWLFYYRADDPDRYGVMVAPAGPRSAAGGTGCGR
jgi:hypothetical protein